MENLIYINGSVVVEQGVFYAKNIAMYASDEFKAGAKIITPPNGVLRISEDYGSLFTCYYVKSGITMYGFEGSGITIFAPPNKTEYESYKEHMANINKLIEEAVVPQEVENLFLQQQYISAFSVLEYFLFNTFMRHVCNNYNTYIKVLSSQLRCLEYGKEITDILRGIHDLKQEKIFIQQAKEVVYHNTKQISALFSVAFGISVDLNILNSHINTRNDIVHRFGHTKKGDNIYVRKDNVLSLITKIDVLVQKVERDMKEFYEK